MRDRLISCASASCMRPEQRRHHQKARKSQIKTGAYTGDDTGDERPSHHEARL
jgi:hypothetical protein